MVVATFTTKKAVVFVECRLAYFVAPASAIVDVSGSVPIGHLPGRYFVVGCGSQHNVSITTTIVVLLDVTKNVAVYGVDVVVRARDANVSTALHRQRENGGVISHVYRLLLRHGLLVDGRNLEVSLAIRRSKDHANYLLRLDPSRTRRLRRVSTDVQDGQRGLTPRHVYVLSEVVLHLQTFEPLVCTSYGDYIKS